MSNFDNNANQQMNINIEVQNSSNQVELINTSSYQASLNFDPSSIDDYVDLSQMDDKKMTFEEKLAEIKDSIQSKQVVSERTTTGDESLMYGKVTEYSDGTKIYTDLNPVFYPNMVMLIEVPQNADGTDKIITHVFDGREDGLAFQILHSITEYEYDDIYGKIDNSRSEVIEEIYR